MTQSHTDDDYYVDGEEHNDGPRYLAPADISAGRLHLALGQLCFLQSDPYFRTQAFNLDMTDRFIMELEYATLREWFDTESTPPEAYFLGAQSQMWIFAAYELQRSWREWASEIKKWSATGGLNHKLASMKSQAEDFSHFGIEAKIDQLEEVIAKPELVPLIVAHLDHTYTSFKMLEFLRVALAKNQVSGKPKLIPSMPTHGRINKECGALDYELQNGKYIIGQMSRRDVADAIRGLDLAAAPPSKEDLASFDAYIKGPSSETFLQMGRDLR
ncbi:MAG: hypothetical protein JWQ10_1997 [Herbaspirillum sp.]|nr:hypothetical protein [Herbaspirillum sp.]